MAAAIPLAFASSCVSCDKIWLHPMAAHLIVKIVWKQHEDIWCTDIYARVQQVSPQGDHVPLREVLCIQCQVLLLLADVKVFKSADDFHTSTWHNVRFE